MSERGRPLRRPGRCAWNRTPLDVEERLHVEQPQLGAGAVDAARKACAGAARVEAHGGLAVTGFVSTGVGEERRLRTSVAAWEVGEAVHSASLRTALGHAKEVSLKRRSEKTRAKQRGVRDPLKLDLPTTC